MTNKGEAIVNVDLYTWHCGDGCCYEEGYDVSIEIDGVEVLDKRYMWDYDAYAVQDVLESLGYKVITNE